MRLLLATLLCAVLLGGDELVLPASDRLQAQALAYAQSAVAGLDGTYTFKYISNSILPRVTKGDLTFEPTHLSRTDPTGRFYASFNVQNQGRTIGMVRVDLEGQWTGKLLRCHAALPRKAVPAEGQLEAFEFEGTPPAGALRSLPEGMRLRGPVAQGHILVRADLEPIPLVLMGDTVRVELVQGDLSITAEAVARSSGALGEKVRLEMPVAHKMLQAVVTGPDEARVQWGGSK